MSEERQLCDGEIDFTGEGYWFCLKCGFYAGIPGETNTKHHSPDADEQKTNAELAIRMHLRRLMRSGLTVDEAYTFMVGALCNMANENRIYYATN